MTKATLKQHMKYLDRRLKGCRITLIVPVRPSPVQNALNALKVKRVQESFYGKL